VSIHDLPLGKSLPFAVHNEFHEQIKVYMVLLPSHTLTSSQGVRDDLQYIKHCNCMSVAIPAISAGGVIASYIPHRLSNLS
jgi:hypothetical protein